MVENKDEKKDGSIKETPTKKPQPETKQKQPDVVTPKTESKTPESGGTGVGGGGFRGRGFGRGSPSPRGGGFNGDSGFRGGRGGFRGGRGGGGGQSDQSEAQESGGGRNFRGGRGGSRGGRGGGPSPNEVEERSNSPEGGSRGSSRGGRFSDRGGGGRGGRGGGMSRGGGSPGGERVGRGGFRGRGGGSGGGGRPSWSNWANPEERVFEKLVGIFANQGTSDPLPEEPPKERKKFTGHCRLFVGNLPPSITDEEFEDLFKPYGETFEPFVNRDKNFGFIRLDYRENAEKAKCELDDKPFKDPTRPLKVRFAAHQGSVRVKNLSPWVSNELLEKSFSIFGDIERAVVVTDVRGRSTGEAIVEFTQKPHAMVCLQMTKDHCFFLTSSPRPVFVEMAPDNDEFEGLQDKNLSRRNPEFLHERSQPPRFAPKDSFEHEYGQRWRQLEDLEKQKIEAVKAEMRYEREKLEAQMEYAKHDHEINTLKQQLRQRELEKERQIQEQENRQRILDERRRREEEAFRQKQEQLQADMERREQEMRRRALENTRFLEDQMSGSAGGGADSSFGSGGVGGAYGDYGSGPGNKRGFDASGDSWRGYGSGQQFDNAGGGGGYGEHGGYQSGAYQLLPEVTSEVSCCAVDR
ncbi:unnamed protein product [Cyprideis torosa]|uniref:Uncharacterized protein n=1 Tax=Cyprideis torosa TaxID=163714 RepID=A0A7R8WE39_9CRUS|nr:unnamed protein product [Cyprideis torosa]CAG0895393.1 unnamed protein product [Cyprideis torosa]